MNQPIRTAIVGLGRIGLHHHLEELKKRPAFQITAVVDPDSARTAQAAKSAGCQEFSTLEQMLDKTELDLVVIATPTVQHGSDAKLALSRGCHCVLEKPMTLSLREAQEVVEIARSAKRHLFVHHQLPFSPDFNFLREVVDSGVLGELFEIRCLWSCYERRWDWQALAKNGGGALNNNFPHLLSMALPLIDSPVREVFADMRTIKDAGDAEDYAHLVLITESGRTMDLTVTTACALPGPLWMLMGTTGTLQISGTWIAGEEATLKYFDLSKVEPRSIVDGPCPAGMSFRENLPWKEEKRPVKPQHPSLDFYDNVSAVLLDGAVQVVTPESALAVMRVIDLARKSAKSRTPLTA